MAATLIPTREKMKKVRPFFNGMEFIVTPGKASDINFRKSEIQQLIKCAKGGLVAKVTKMPKDKPIYLISDALHRSYKYFTALAHSIPCISYQWVIDCIEKNQRLDYTDYLLPAGISYTGEVISWHSNYNLLRGKKVCIFSNKIFDNKPSFAQLWTPLVKCMGGNIMPCIPNDELDILVTDSSCDEVVLSSARSLGAFTVSREWIIQALIIGGLPKPDAYDRFRPGFRKQTSK